MRGLRRMMVLSLLLALTACSSIYYSGLEKIGIPKRDLMVFRVEKARDTQEETKEQFKSALDHFMAVTHVEGGDLETTYKQLNEEYEASVSKAEEVSQRISTIEDVAEALFAEWEQELTQYSNAALKRSSQKKLTATKTHYQQLMAAMKRAEATMAPVLTVFKDQVLYLKHNLNAQAIASLKGELGSIKSEVATLISAMETSINEANAFIKTLEK
jgi:hypothetical protein